MWRDSSAGPSRDPCDPDLGRRAVLQAGVCGEPLHRTRATGPATPAPEVVLGRWRPALSPAPFFPNGPLLAGQAALFSGKWPRTSRSEFPRPHAASLGGGSSPLSAEEAPAVPLPSQEGPGGWRAEPATVPGAPGIEPGMSNWDSPKCLNIRIEINVPSLLAPLTIHYSKHLPKVKRMLVYPHEIHIKTRGGGGGGSINEGPAKSPQGRGCSSSPPSSSSSSFFFVE